MICNYGYCETCYGTLGNAHHHTLSKMNLDQMKMGENSVYLCDAIYFKGCLTPANASPSVWSDGSTVLYHESVCNFDLCSPCMENYKAKVK